MVIEFVSFDIKLSSPTHLTDAEVQNTLADMEESFQYRFRMLEILPVEMSRYRIGFYVSLVSSLAFHGWNVVVDIDVGADGGAFFTIPELFECSLTLQEDNQDDGWLFVHVEFLFNVGGDQSGMQGKRYINHL